MTNFRGASNEKFIARIVIGFARIYADKETSVGQGETYMRSQLDHESVFYVKTKIVSERQTETMRFRIITSTAVGIRVSHRSW